MKKIVINQMGKIIDGEPRELILEASSRGDTNIELEGAVVEIKSVTKTDCVETVNVLVNLVNRKRA